VVKQYINGVSVSKIASILKICKRNIKPILIDKNVWVENRDEIKKIFNEYDTNSIINKYVNEKLSCQAIAKYYNVSKRPINRILKEKGLLRKGLSNGIKINLTDEQKDIVKKLYIEGYKNYVEIADLIGVNKHYVDKYLHNCGFRRDKSEGTSIGLVKRWGNRGYDEYLDSLSEFKEYKKELNEEKLVVDIQDSEGKILDLNEDIKILKEEIDSNKEKIGDINFKIDKSALLSGNYIVVQKGKKNYFLVKQT
jgi:transposase